MSDLKGELASLKIDRTPPPRNPWRRSLLLLLPAALGLLVLYGLRARQTLAAPEVSTVEARVEAGEAAGAPGTPLLTASGYVVARRKAVVSAKIQGRLAQLRVEEGSRVREGDVIARLEDADFVASVERARAAAQRAEADLGENRRQLALAEKLAQQDVLALDQRDAAQSRVRIAEAALAQARADLVFAEAQLQNTVIRAPFTGVVVKKMAEVGESVAPIPPGVNISTASGAIVALADLATLEVEADVAEANVAKLSDAQPAEATVEAFPDQRYKAVLRQVIPTADRTKATVQVKVTILDKDKNLKPEMSAKVTFLEKEAPRDEGAPPPRVVTAPADAVASRDGRSVVFEVVEGRARRRAVSVGGERQGRVVIREGLAGGELLVARPPEGLKDGDAVRVKG
ncbi:MAG TPA: efflux RND transporter periplasmic adaptor subunit [Vicinamibacteria bacterium]|nr:efflux RND transporter periplasmic adaptor subunit [Vicinamibacteria bacterium]